MHPIIERLRQRKIVQWGLGYLASAWLVYQLLQSLGEPWGVLAGHLRTLQVVLGLGLPVVLVVAWYHGEKGHQRVTRSEAVALVVVGLFASGAFVVARPRLDPAIPDSSDFAGVAENSIVVLPFADLSPEGDQEYLAFGIAEELLNVLAQVPELQVMSRTSAFAFSDRDGMTLPEIARRLRVAHVVDGSVRRAGDEVRVTVQLIDTRTDAHLLSANYDGTLDNVLTLQDSIAAEVVSSLQLEIFGAPPGLERTNAEAYQLFLLGRHVLNQRDGDWFERSVDLLEQVLDADPDYLPAILWLSLAYLDESLGLPQTEAEPLRARSSDLVDRALALDPNSARAHGIRSGLLHPADLQGMADEMQRALDLAAPDPEMLMWAGFTLQLLDRHEEAVPFFEYKVERDPLDIISLTNLALVYHHAGDYEGNIRVRERIEALEPGRGTGGIGLALLLLGRVSEAARLIDPADSTFTTDLISTLAAHSLGDDQEYRDNAEAFEERWGDQQPGFAAMVYAWGGEADSAFRFLDRLTPYTATLGGMIPLNSRPEFDPIHGDPRWDAFLARVGQSRERFQAVQFDPAPPPDIGG